MPKTSRRTILMETQKANSKPVSFQAGFTLIELLIVVTIIALISAFAVPRLSSVLKASLDSTSRQMASKIKEAYNASVISGQVHRFVYDLDEGLYWVEVGPSQVMLHTEESLEKELRKQRFSRETTEKKPQEFRIETSITPRKKALPRGVSFSSIETDQSDAPIEEGIVYTHFFPHGLSERTLIHLVDSSNHKMALFIESLIGRTRVIPGDASREEVFVQ